jgi:regulatory protein
MHDDGDPREQPATSRLLLAVRPEPGGVVLVLEGGEDLELAADAVPPDLPGPGTVLTGALLTDLRHAADRKRAARRIFAILDRRLVPSVRLRRKLAAEGHPAEAVDDVLEQMARRGLYSDRRFADAWCREALRSRAVGRRYLERKLREKGIAGAVAREAATAALAPEDEAELARRAAAARWRKITGPDDRRTEAKVVRHLVGRGFDTGLAVRATRSVRDELNRDDGEST